jgi:hypothetical protein
MAAARERHRPDPVRLVFVAEAPPPPESDRFFYFENVRRGDALFLNVMRAVYRDVRAIDPDDVALIRSRKRELLEAFKRDGFYLIDASDTSMPRKASDAVKRRLLREALPTLRETIADLRDGRRQLPFVLISATVYDVCRDPLVRSGVNVLNSEPIDFPLGNWQDRFHERVGRVLTGGFAPRRSGVLD